MFEGFEFYHSCILQHSFLLGYDVALRVQTLKVNAPYATETSGIYYPVTSCHIRRMELLYRGADKSLARRDWKKIGIFAILRPTRRSLLLRRPAWTDNLLNCFLSGL